MKDRKNSNSKTVRLSEGFHIKLFLKGKVDLPQLPFFKETFHHKYAFNSKQKHFTWGTGDANQNKSQFSFVPWPSELPYRLVKNVVWITHAVFFCFWQGCAPVSDIRCEISKACAPKKCFLNLPSVKNHSFTAVKSYNHLS